MSWLTENTKKYGEPTTMITNGKDGSAHVLQGWEGIGWQLMITHHNWDAWELLAYASFEHAKECC